MRKLIALACVSAAALAAAAARPEAGAAPGRTDAPVKEEQRPTHGFVFGQRGGASLVRLDPESLRALPGQLLVGRHTFGWSYSPDRTRLALGSDGNSPEVLFVDEVELKEVGRVRVERQGLIAATRWLPDGRVLAVVAVPGCCAVGTTSLVTVDPATRKVVGRRVLKGALVRVASVPDALVLLLAPTGRIGPARLAVVRDAARVRIVGLSRIAAGLRHPKARSEPYVVRIAQPGLAVDPVASRAYVVSGGGEVASVGLFSGAVAYRRPGAQRSLIGRLAAWLQPSAEAKALSGPLRFARWLGDGLLAVSGGDQGFRVADETIARSWWRPAGATIIDTRTWSAQTLDAGADHASPAGELVLATGSAWESGKRERTIGLVAYDRDGSVRFRLLGGRSVYVEYADAERAYVRDAEQVAIVDLAAGRVVERTESVPMPLSPGAPGVLG